MAASTPRYTQTRTADVGIGALDALIAAQKPEWLDAGTVLLRQGEASEFAYYLVEGDVVVLAESEYGRTELASIAPPRLIGELGVLAAYPRTATIEARTRICVYRLTAAQLIEVGHKAPDFLLSVIGQLGRQIDGTNRALSLYGNALAALERREFDSRILDELANPSPQLVTFATTFKRFAAEIIDKRRQADDLASAAIIQRSFLPRPELLERFADKIEFGANMRPARDVGGDFYDYFALGDDKIGIAIGDVCGKGIPASLFMAVAITTLRNAAQTEASVHATISHTNASLCRDNDASMFATLFYGVLDLATGGLEYANCGHNAPYILSPAGRQSLGATGIPMGLIADRPAKTKTVTLGRSDTFVLFTDGVTEAMNPGQEEFGTARLEPLIDRADAQPIGELLQRIYEAVDSFADGEDQADDITCLALRLKG